MFPRSHGPAVPPKPTLCQKLEILADAAKYDASCASSGTAKKNSLGGKGVGSTEGLFLPSGIVRSANHTMEQLVEVAQLTASLAKVRPFICTLDWRPTLLTDHAALTG